MKQSLIFYKVIDYDDDDDYYLGKFLKISIKDNSGSCFSSLMK